MQLGHPWNGMYGTDIAAPVCTPVVIHYNVSGPALGSSTHFLSVGHEHSNCQHLSQHWRIHGTFYIQRIIVHLWRMNVTNFEYSVNQLIKVWFSFRLCHLYFLVHLRSPFRSISGKRMSNYTIFSRDLFNTSKMRRSTTGCVTWSNRRRRRRRWRCCPGKDMHYQ